MHCTASDAGSARLAAMACFSAVCMALLFFRAVYAKLWLPPADQRSLKTAHATTHQIWNGTICNAASNSCIRLVWACWHLDDMWKESQTLFNVMAL